MTKRVDSPSIKKTAGTALVTGAAGFIGSHLVRTLLKKGFAVYGVDNFITGRRENITPLLAEPRFHFFTLDIVDPVFLEKFSEIPVREIYHLACPTGVPNITRLGEEMMLASSIGTRHVLELARKHNARIIFTSSSEIYGEAVVTPQDEDYTGNVNPIGPRSPYEEGKRFAEGLVAFYVKKYGIDGDIVRLFNTYGPSMSPEDQRVIPRFLRCVAEGQPLIIYGDGAQTRTFCYIDDLIQGLELVMAKGKQGEVYNIGSGRPIAIRELAELVIQLTGHPHGVTFTPHFIEDHHHRKPSLARVRSLGWQETIHLSEGLKRMIAAWGTSPQVMSHE